MGGYRRRNVGFFRLGAEAGDFAGRIFPVLLGCILASSACGRAGAKGPETPERTMVSFSRALGQGKLREAYGLMSSSYRERVSYQQFERQLTENPDESLEMSNSLAHVQGQPRKEAIVRYGDDAELHMEMEDGRWYIATPVVDFYDQSTPRAALIAFVRAMERKRYDVVIRLIPESDKEGITTDRMSAAWSGDGREEVERMLENLRNHLDAPIEEVGDRATMPYGERTRVQFVREGELWKIEDPE